MLHGDGLVMIGKRKFNFKYFLYHISVSFYKTKPFFRNKEITWYLPRSNVTSVELVFKENTYIVGTDLKIFSNQHTFPTSTSTTTTTTTAATTTTTTTAEVEKSAALMAEKVDDTHGYVNGGSSHHYDNIILLALCNIASLVFNFTD